MIKVYGKENCTKCTELKAILNNKGIEFEYIDNRRELMMAASKARIMSAPIIDLDGKVMGMEDFLKEVK